MKEESALIANPATVSPELLWKVVFLARPELERVKCCHNRRKRSYFDDFAPTTPMGLEKTTFPIVARQADDSIGFRTTSSIDQAPAMAVPPRLRICMVNDAKDWVALKKMQKLVSF